MALNPFSVLSLDSKSNILYIYKKKKNLFPLRGGHNLGVMSHKKFEFYFTPNLIKNASLNS